jgi:hypothetical protein
MIKKSVYFGVFILFIVGVVSCEKDFNDIASNVVKNTKFDTKDTIIDVVVTNKAITSVRGDGLKIGGTLGQYLLGVYNNPNYEKIEASIISQIVLDTDVGDDIDPGEREYGADTTIVTTIDTVFLKLPYQATLVSGSTNADYTLDSIIGDKTKAFNLNIYRTDTYMNRLDPVDPSKANNYQSNFNYQILPGELNATTNYQFKPSALDTALIYKSKLSNGAVYKTDTIALTNNIPFARVGLDKAKFKDLFVDKFGSSEFASQEAFNEYFKGLYIGASGNEGSLISFLLNNSNQLLRPSIELRYTKTVVKGGSTVVDTIQKSNTFLLSNFSTSEYKMTEIVYPANKIVVIQGTAGNMAEVELFDAAQINLLKSKNWLINDVSLTFYVDQDIVKFDTIATPFRLFLYKDGSPKSQVKDLTTEGDLVFGGNLIVTDKKPDYYSFKITDYVSDFLDGTSNYNPTLGLRVLNATDIPQSAVDTLVRNYNWNPKAVTLLNHDKVLNGERRARIKISYSIKK